MSDAPEPWILDWVTTPEAAGRLQRRLDKARARAEVLAAPAALAHDLALEMGATARAAAAIERAGACLYAAADLADDIADGAVARDSCDVERLLMMIPLALDGGGLDDSARRAIVRRLMRGGLRMCIGQEEDLRHTGRPTDADPVFIAEAKAGEELAALFSVAAIAAECDLDGPARFGLLWGAALQALSDLEDLFSPGESRDWTNVSPSAPLARLLSHPRWGDTAATWLAGTAALPARHAVRRGLLASIGLDEWIDEIETRWLTPAESAAAPLHSAVLSRCVEVVRERLAHWRPLLAPVPSPRRMDRRLSQDVETAERAARGYLLSEPTLRETEEVHRWGLFGEPVVVGGLFGRLLTLAQLTGLDWDLSEARAIVSALEDEDGWRYYPGFPQIPTDADDTGLALFVLRDAPAADRARWAEQLLRAQREDGSFPVWLSAHQGPWRWDDRDCPGVQANALRGLCTVDGVDPSALAAAAAHLDRQLLGAIASPHYGPVLRDGLAVEALAAMSLRGPGFSGALDRLRSRLERPHAQSPLQLSVAATALTACDAPVPWGPVLRRLIDAWGDGGSLEAGDLFRTVHRHGATTYRSRIVTTAWGIRAIRESRIPDIYIPRSTTVSSMDLATP